MQSPYTVYMDKDKHLERYLRLCQRLYERMEADGSWPWKSTPTDSTESEDLVESDSEKDDV